MDKDLILSLTIIAGQVGTVLAFFFFLLKKNKDEINRPEAVTESAKQEHPDAGAIKANSLQDELNKTKADYSMAQNELKELKKKEAYLSKELIEQKDSFEPEKNKSEQLLKENKELKNKLADIESESGKNISEQAKAAKEISEKDDKIRLLEKQNNEALLKLNDSNEQLKRLDADLKTRDIDKGEQNKRDKLKPEADASKITRASKQVEAQREKKHKIGEILLENNFISKEILDKAVEFSHQTGGNITQYLLAYGYIDDAELAKCLCTQFGMPYLPLRSYNIPEEIIKLVPVDIAERYWVLPVDRIENFLTVVMADPFDNKAIREIEKASGCKVRPFVGILSEIIESLENYYKIIIKAKTAKSIASFFIETGRYKGMERRSTIRFDVEIDVQFAVGGDYKKSKILNVCRDGFLLKSDSVLPVGSFLTLQIDLPREFCPLPVAVVVQVIRITLIKENNYEIGLKTVKILKQELDTILEYAYTHEVKNISEESIVTDNKNGVDIDKKVKNKE